MNHRIKEIEDILNSAPIVPHKMGSISLNDLQFNGLVDLQAKVKNTILVAISDIKKEKIWTDELIRALNTLKEAALSFKRGSRDMQKKANNLTSQ